MRSLVNFRPVVAALVLFASLPAFSHAAVQNRITAAVDDAQTVQLQENLSPLVKQAVDQGQVAAAQPLSNLALNFQPSATQQAALDALLIAQQDPSSGSYHKWLTPAQFGAQFGMSQSDLAKVTAWLQSHGFAVEGVAASGNSVHFSGTAAQVEEAFHTSIHSYALNGETHLSNSSQPSLPNAFAATVSSIRGLNDFRLKPRVKMNSTLVPYSTRSSTSSSVGAHFVSSGSEYLAPEDFANIYDVKALYSSGYSGSSSFPIAVVGQTAVNTADITDFRTGFGLTTNTPTMVLMPGTGSSAINSTNDLGESELDLEWSGAVAPSAPIYFIYTGNAKTGSSFTYGVFDALQYAIQTYTVNSKVIPIISISYGECEPSDTTADFTTFEGWFKQANAQGQTIVSAAGDAGAADCDFSTTSANSYQATQGLAVDYPASSAYVTGMGGTSFSGDLTSQSTYWSTSNDTNFGNELGLYIPSSSWNDTQTTAEAVSHKGLEASGGGASALWSKPSWQAGVTGIPSDSKRDVPDISLNADPDHDGYLTCYNLSCEASTPTFSVIGGTSAGAPAFAGMLALIEQKLGASQGNINPTLYTLASNATTYASAFHDITTGTNIVPCVTGTTNCTSGTLGFSTTSGYDQVTGLGSVDALNLANAFAASAAVSSKLYSTIATTYSPTSPAINATVTFTSTVASSNGSTVPSGTVVFTVDGAATGTSETVSSSGIATFSSTFSTAGSHTVVAVYSGDANFYGSTVTTTVTVGASTGTGSITLASTPTTITVTSGSSGSSTVTITSSGGYAGTVNLAVTTATSSLSSLGSFCFTLASSATTCSSSVTVASGGSTSGTLTIYTGSTTAAIKGATKFGGSTGVSKLAAGGGIAFAGLFLFGLTGTRRKRLSIVLSLLVFSVLIAGTGCSSSSSTTSTTSSNVAAGTYTITVTGTDSSTSTITGSTNITVVVQ